MFECGEIVEISIIYRIKGIVKERRQKVVILKILEDKFQVCDFVLASNKKSFRKVQTNQGIGFASISNIYMAKEERCNYVGLHLTNPQRQIDFILRKNEEWKFVRAEKRQKRAQAKIEREQKHIERMKKQKKLKAESRKADKVKDVTDQGYYLDGCPTTGSPAVLVIPVEFSDVTAASKGYTTSALAQAFSEGGDVDYYSVYDYYYISSYGNLTLDITVLDEWFRPEKNSSYYYKATYDYYGDEVAIGDQLILDEALAYLEGKMDLSKFDSDNNGIIDAVVLVNTLDVGEEDFYWAYRYWNIYTDNDGYYYEYDGVSANDYVWASYQFLNEGIDENGETYYDTSIMNTYTFIHEFAHILGLDDYYDTSYSGDGPLEGADMMDAMMGDHNAYSKFNLGWITTSRLVVTNSSVTLKLEDFSKTGDTIILANNWDEKLGAYQEYYVLIYYKNEGLNAGDGAGFFARDGIVVYHVNASLYSEVYDGETYYDVYNNNTDASDQYGTKDNLIEFVKSAGDTFTFIVGDTLPNNVVDDNGASLKYTFTIDVLTSDYATITFTVK